MAALAILLAGSSSAPSAADRLAADVPAEAILDALLAEPAPARAPAEWRTEWDLQQGAGYARNVQFSPFDGQNSAFAVSEAELLLHRYPEAPHRVSLYAFGSHRHYVDVSPGSGEYSALAQGEWAYVPGRRGEGGLTATYQYFDQFFDASISDIELDATRLKQQEIGGSAFTRYAFSPAASARVESGYKTVRLDDSDDDYRQWNAVAALEHLPAAGLTIGLACDYRIDDYDERAKRTGAGEELPGDPVAVDSREIRTYGAWYWDTARNWRLRWRVGRRSRDDDGGGYYDYASWLGTVGLRGRMGAWTAEARAGYTDTRYDRRPSDLLDVVSATLRRDRWEATLRAERQLGRHWSAFADVAWESNDANNPLDVYDHVAGSIGIGYHRGP